MNMSTTILSCVAVMSRARLKATTLKISKTIIQGFLCGWVAKIQKRHIGKPSDIYFTGGEHPATKFMEKREEN